MSAVKCEYYIKIWYNKRKIKVEMKFLKAALNTYLMIHVLWFISYNLYLTLKFKFYFSFHVELLDKHFIALNYFI